MLKPCTLLLAARKVLLIPHTPRPIGPRPIRSTLEALKAMLAEGDIQGLSEAHAAGWAGVYRMNGVAGWVVGARLTGDWSDFVAGEASTGGVPQLMHIPTGLYVCKASDKRTPELSKRVNEALKQLGETP